jgi:hypothetical protein
MMHMGTFDHKAERRKRCNSLLTALMGKNNIDLWWNSRNKHWDMKTPNEQWEIDYESVYNYLMHQCNGDYS